MYIKCFHCNQDIVEESKGVLISIDGDFVHDSCEKIYKAEKDHFLNVVIHDDTEFAAWLKE